MKDKRLAPIDRVVAVRGVTRTELVVRSRERPAIETLSAGSTIELGGEAYDALVAALDAPVVPNETLKRQLAHRPLWDG